MFTERCGVFVHTLHLPDLSLLALWDCFLKRRGREEQARLDHLLLGHLHRGTNWFRDFSLLIVLSLRFSVKVV